MLDKNFIDIVPRMKKAHECWMALAIRQVGPMNQKA